MNAGREQTLALAIVYRSHSPVFSIEVPAFMPDTDDSYYINSGNVHELLLVIGTSIAPTCVRRLTKFMGRTDARGSRCCNPNPNLA